MSAIKAYLQHAESRHRIVEKNYPHLTDWEKRLTFTVEENVLVQFESLGTQPSDAAAIDRVDLKLHG